MTESQARRWEALRAMSPGEPDALVTFEDKLIRQTGWPRSYAQSAIDEYRKFLFLAAEAGHPVSPSPAVDEVWHLHLLYTRHYWDVLCPQMLGMSLHHEPATGAAADHSKLNDWYATTLASYRTFFNADAPAEFWPTTPSTGQFVRVDAEQNIVLPRLAVRGAMIWAAAILIILLTAVLWVFLFLGRMND